MGIVATEVALEKKLKKAAGRREATYKQRVAQCCNTMTDNHLKAQEEVFPDEKTNAQPRELSSDELCKVAGGLTDAEAIDLQLRQLEEQAKKAKAEQQAQIISTMTQQHGGGGIIRNM